MCICFVHLNDDPDKFPFRVCVASNRDESFDRPAERLHQWPDHDIIGGRDATPGREKGAWLAVHKTSGKLGCLLNIRDRTFPPQQTGEPRLGRGTLVPDFLRSPLSARDFAEHLIKKGEKYDPFLLLMLQPNEQSGHYEGHFLTNLDHQLVAFSESEGAKSFAFSNSHPDRPYLKVSAGLRCFENVIAEFGGATVADLGGATVADPGGATVTDPAGATVTDPGGATVADLGEATVADPGGATSADPGGATSADRGVSQELLEALFGLLSMPDSHFPDDNLRNVFPVDFPEAYLLQLSSIFVAADHGKRYGTRTQTLFLLDFHGNASIWERDTQPPVIDGSRAGPSFALNTDVPAGCSRCDFRIGEL